MADGFESDGRNGFSCECFDLRKVFHLVLIFSFSGVPHASIFRPRSLRCIELAQASDHSIDLRLFDQTFRKKFA